MLLHTINRIFNFFWKWNWCLAALAQIPSINFEYILLVLYLTGINISICYRNNKNTKNWEKKILPILFNFSLSSSGIQNFLLVIIVTFLVFSNKVHWGWVNFLWKTSTNLSPLLFFSYTLSSETSSPKFPIDTTVFFCPYFIPLNLDFYINWG